MKRNVKPIIFALLAGLCLGASVLPASAETTETTETTDTAGSEETVLDGWQKSASGKKQYYEDGTAVTGLKKIGSKWYFFDKNGDMRTGTVQCDGWKYYLGSDGVLELRQKGTKTYYYSKKKKLVKSKGKGATYYSASGKKLKKADAADVDAYLKARVVADAITTTKMSKSRKLKVCFRWVMDKYYKTWRTFRAKKGWTATNASDHFDHGRGDCHADASAFAYLAKAIGYSKVYVCNDSKGEGHSWAEIGGKVYDPLFAQSKSYKKNYGVSYKTYKLHPILHVKITERLSKAAVTKVQKVTLKTKTSTDTSSGTVDSAKKNGGWDSTGTYYYDKKTGKKLTGVHVINDKFYVFSAKGKYNKTKTAKLRKAAKYQKSFSGVKKILGEPKKIKYYGSSCFSYKGEGGKDGVAIYDNFRLSIFKTSKTNKIIYMGVE